MSQFMLWLHIGTSHPRNIRHTLVQHLINLTLMWLALWVITDGQLIFRREIHMPHFLRSIVSFTSQSIAAMNNGMENLLCWLHYCHRRLSIHAFTQRICYRRMFTYICVNKLGSFIIGPGYGLYVRCQAITDQYWLIINWTPVPSETSPTDVGEYIEWVHKIWWYNYNTTDAANLWLCV